VRPPRQHGHDADDLSEQTPSQGAEQAEQEHRRLEGAEDAAAVPFIGLAEAFVLQAARRAGVPRHRIRPGVEAVKSGLGLEHALASRLLYAARLQLPGYGPADVVVDPTVAFGYPVVKGKGTRVKDVLERFWAGESVRATAGSRGSSHASR
jgi:hypothetical protein